MLRVYALLINNFEVRALSHLSMFKYFIFFVISCASIIQFDVVAQQTVFYKGNDASYRDAVELFQKQKFAAAQQSFAKLLQQPVLPYEYKSNALFYAAICAAELYNKDAEFRLLKFLEHYPEHKFFLQAQLALGNYYYRNKKNKKAIEIFESITPSALTADEKPEYYFRLGYAYYNDNQYEKAASAFFNVVDSDSKYATAATYYYAHMQFVNKNYETALKNFIKLKDSESFGSVVPYYITQIYYKQGKYAEVVKYAPPKLDSGATKNGLEIERLVGESHYKAQQFKEAIPYLEDYEKNSGGVTSTDHYVLGYSYFMTGAYRNAVAQFKEASVANDSIAQFAAYQMGAAYLKLDDKRNARLAYQSSSRLPFSKEVKEESSFLSSKLTYELSMYDAAITNTKNFIKEFPNSVHLEEANELLIEIFTNTHNYKEAYEALATTKVKSPRMKEAMQRVTYFRGIDLFTDDQVPEALKMFNESIANSVDAKLTALAHYWKAEAYYKLKSFSDAEKSYTDFIVSPMASSLPEYNTANYGMGYALLKQESYSKAQEYFKKYTSLKVTADIDRFNDAMIRLADCKFMLRDANGAADYYQQAINNKAKGSDYAYYQKAIIYGVQGDMNKKIASLQSLMDKYPKSSYTDDALYEAGSAALIIDKNEQALNYFKKITTTYASSPYYKRALIGTGIAYENSDNDEQALLTYKAVVNQFPNTTECNEALVKIKNIYVEQNKVEEYLAYVKTTGQGSVSNNEQDSLTYVAAEFRYTNDNCDEAIRDFKNYLEKYPRGMFTLNAHYYRSDCLYRMKKFDESLAGFEYVIGQPSSKFSETSLSNAALITYRNKNYSEAAQYFEQLLTIAKDKENQQGALLGVMRSNYKLSIFNKAASAAEKLLETATDKALINEAHFILGKHAYIEKDMSTAKKEFAFVGKKNAGAISAEAKYNLALIAFQESSFKECQSIVFEIAKMSPSYNYWIGKAFILLGDSYVAQKDYFQAKETFKSIIDNYKPEADEEENIKLIAQQKYDDIIASDGKRIIEGNRAIPIDSTDN